MRKRKRASLTVDAQAIARVRKALGASTNAEAIRLAVDRVVEMERYWRFMTMSRRTLRTGSIEEP